MRLLTDVLDLLGAAALVVGLAIAAGVGVAVAAGTPLGIAAALVVGGALVLALSWLLDRPAGRRKREERSR